MISVLVWSENLGVVFEAKDCLYFCTSWPHFSMFSSIEFLGSSLIKVTETDSPYFKVISPSAVGYKVSPGMDNAFMLQFTNYH